MKQETAVPEILSGSPHEAGPLVSVIIPAYNSAATLVEAVNSARRQTLPSVEILVVDDGSTDGTPRIMESLAAQDSRIHIIRHERNSGVSCARNAALARAAGKWIAVLDADDVYEPRRLEDMVAAAAEHQADVMCDNLKVRYCDSPGIVTVTKWHENNQVTPLTLHKLFPSGIWLGRRLVGLAKPLIRAEFLRQNRLAYDERLSLGEDNLLLAELFLSGARIFFMPEAHYVYLQRTTDAGKTASGVDRPRKWSDLILLYDALLEKYGEKTPDLVRRRILKRRQTVVNWVYYMTFRDVLGQGRVAEAAGLLVRKPFVSVYIAGFVARQIQSAFSCLF